MKVILKNKVKNLGNIGDVVTVKDGYARNMLIPNGFALFYTSKNYEAFKLKKDALEKENQEQKKIAEELKGKISSRDVILIENAGDDGKLYGSISGAKLASFINTLLKITTLKKSNVTIRETIKEIGKYTVDVSLHPEVSLEKEIIVARSKEEAIKIKRGDFDKKEEKTLINDSRAKAEAAARATLATASVATPIVASATTTAVEGVVGVAPAEPVAVQSNLKVEVSAEKSST